MILLRYTKAVMKFQALFIIYLIGVEAKRQSGSRAEKYLLRNAFRSLLGSESQPQPDEKPFPANHGNVALRPPKYGHLGLKAAPENSVDGSSGEGGIFGALGLLPVKHHPNDGSQRSPMEGEPENSNRSIAKKKKDRSQWEVEQMATVVEAVPDQNVLPGLPLGQAQISSLGEGGGLGYMQGQLGIGGAQYGQGNIQGQYSVLGQAGGQGGILGAQYGQSNVGYPFVGQAGVHTGIIGAQYGQEQYPVLGQAGVQGGIVGAQYGQGQYPFLGQAGVQSGIVGAQYGQEQYPFLGQAGVQSGVVGAQYGQEQYPLLGQAGAQSGVVGGQYGQGQYPVLGQGGIVGAQYGQGQYPALGQAGVQGGIVGAQYGYPTPGIAPYYGLAPNVAGGYGFQSSLMQIPGIQQRYIIKVIPGQVAPLSYPVLQNNIQGQYSVLGQPGAAAGQVVGSAAGQGMGSVSGESKTQEQVSVDQSAVAGGGGAAAAGQGAQAAAIIEQNASLLGQSAGSFGKIDAHVQNGLSANAQGMYSGFANPAAVVGAAPASGGALTSLWNLVSGAGSYGGGGQFSSAVLPLAPQLGTTLCPVGYTYIAGRCVFVSTFSRTGGLVPGMFGGVEKAMASAGPVDSGALRAVGRYISPGFYYPPPQHLNSNPNMWDPAARYYFSFDNSPQELSRDVERPYPIPFAKA